MLSFGTVLYPRYAVALINGMAIICFLLGSIPWGVIVSKLVYKKDIRSVGSGNIGTTNAFRAMGRTGGAVVFLLDFGKGLLAGFFALWLANYLSTAVSATEHPAVYYLLGMYGQAGARPSPKMGMDAAFYAGYHKDNCLTLAFLACTAGHIFSPWLKGRGGKGIAVAAGCMFVAFGPIPALLEITVFAILVIATRYVSVGSLAAAVLCPFVAGFVFWPNSIAIIQASLAAALVIWAHRANIARLLHGEENRIGKSKEAT